jgi:hypothetical protein
MDESVLACSHSDPMHKLHDQAQPEALIPCEEPGYSTIRARSPSMTPSARHRTHLRDSCRSTKLHGLLDYLDEVSQQVRGRGSRYLTAWQLPLHI